jgi:CheY-like chemotaxis protein
MAEGPAAGRVIVCDDDPVAREVVTSVLQESGYAVVAEASMGPELIQLVEWLQPEIVIVDNALIGMSGMETIPAVRAILPSAIIVMLSAFDAALVESLSVGADLSVDKMDVAQLGRRIESFVRARAGGEAQALG